MNVELSLLPSICKTEKNCIGWSITVFPGWQMDYGKLLIATGSLYMKTAYTLTQETCEPHRIRPTSQKAHKRSKTEHDPSPRMPHSLGM